MILLSLMHWCCLTTSKVLVTCVTTYRIDLHDNTRGLRNNQCTVATWHMHLLGVYSRFQVTGMIKGIFWVWNFHFQAFWGYENLASIYISWQLISVNKVQPKKVHVVIYCFLKILRLRNLAWDFFGGVKIWSRDFFRFCWNR